MTSADRAKIASHLATIECNMSAIRKLVGVEPGMLALVGGSDAQPKERCLPPGYKSMSKADHKVTRVLVNTPVMNIIGSWFGRKESTLWTIEEALLLKAISPSQQEVQGMGIYYTATIPKEQDIRRRDMVTMLRNWISTELDRARKFVNDQP